MEFYFKHTEPEDLDFMVEILSRYKDRGYRVFYEIMGMSYAKDNSKTSKISLHFRNIRSRCVCNTSIIEEICKIVPFFERKDDSVLVVNISKYEELFKSRRPKKREEESRIEENRVDKIRKEKIRKEKKRKEKKRKRVNTRTVQSSPKNISDEDQKFVTEVVEHLNKQALRKYDPTSRVTVELILEMKKDHPKIEGFKRVIDFKCKEWANTDMEKFLRPMTLFSKSKYPRYLEDAMASMTEEEKEEATRLQIRELLGDPS